MSRVSDCGTTPIRERIRGPSRTGSRPRTRSVPAVTGETQPIIRIVEVFPAPLGPRKPKASPLATSKSIASTAVISPNFFVSPRAWMSDAFADSPASSAAGSSAVDSGAADWGARRGTSDGARSRSESGSLATSWDAERDGLGMGRAWYRRSPASSCQVPDE